MKTSLFLILSLFMVTHAYAKLNVVVSIPPEQEFVQKIGGDRVNSSVMVEVGSSPHTYEPKPSQMKVVSCADLYLSIGVEFEKVWLPKFQNQNSTLRIKDISVGIEKLPMEADHDEESHTHHDKHLDPHVWVTPNNAKIMAQNIYDALIALDANGSDYYHTNLIHYLQELNELQCHIKELLNDVPPQSTFMVFHPSWGYFAKAYNLHQLAVEIEGKNPKPRQMIEIIKEAKTKKVRAIFTQPEFSDKAAQTIAKELGVEVIKTSALAADWSQNLINLARAIRAGSQP